MVLDKAVRIDEDNIAIKRIKERCINCGRCKTICSDVVGINYNEKCKEAVCINCGQCILNCPVGALIPKYDYKKVLNYLHDYYLHNYPMYSLIILKFYFYRH